MAEMLIVDDEKFAVEGICRCNDWEGMGILKVHTANHADEARAILTDRRIDILICDIEMPDEDGLSLVRWVNRHSPHTETLFLTCHSEFDYAKQAVSLGSFDYLLKPVDAGELASAVKRMLQSVKDKEEADRHSEMYRSYRSLWSKQQPILAEHFWQDLLSRRILGFGDFLERALQDAQIGLSPDSRVMPVLISPEEWKKALEPRDQEVMEYALKKAADEIFLSERSGMVVVDKTGVIFVMVYGDGTPMNKEGWERTGRKYIGFCDTYFYCQISCYFGRPVGLQDLPTLCESMKSLERSNVSQTGTVIWHVQPQTSNSAGESLPDAVNVSDWAHDMGDGEKEKVLELIHRSVEQWERKVWFGETQIEACRQEVLLLIHSFMHRKGIVPQQVPHYSVLASAQIRTLKQFKLWAENFLSAVMDAVFAERESDGVVQRAIQYIRENVEEEISRDDVASHVSLNPAYLSRLFKRETGQNIIDFLIDAKMNRAKELLDTTKFSVSAIAQQVGYSNFSHFTRMFKKQFGVNPQEYRKSQND